MVLIFYASTDDSCTRLSTTIWDGFLSRVGTKWGTVAEWRWLLPSQPIRELEREKAVLAQFAVLITHREILGKEL
jgi:hypothetical protein